MTGQTPMGRRALVGFIGFLGLSSISLILLSSPSAAATIEGYAWPTSVVPGDRVDLCVSTDAPAFDVHVYREGVERSPVLGLNGIPGGIQTTPPASSQQGCGWVPLSHVYIPWNWKSGVYTVRFSAPGAPDRWTFFVVREAVPGARDRILVKLPLFTWQAYNSWGGKSLYGYNSTGGTAATTISFRRPYDENEGLSRLPDAVLPFIRWAEAEGFSIAYCTDLDLHLKPSLESSYPLLVDVGHDGYWSKEMRDAVENRIDAGRNVAFLSGNTCWWQVRLSDASDQITCFRNRNQDPLFGIDNSRVTVNWYAWPVGRSENALTGVSYRNGGIVNEYGIYPESRGYGGYTAYRTGSWIYAGTGMADGQVFGRSPAVVGDETDGALFTMENGVPVATGADGSPTSFEILAVSPASYGHATMGLYYRGGATVFTAATIRWAQGLASDHTVSQITENVLNRLSGSTLSNGGVPAVLSPELAVRIRSNPCLNRATFDWTATSEGPLSLSVFDVTGRRVAEVELGGVHEGAATWDGRDRQGRPAAAGFYFARITDGRRSQDAKFIFVR